MIESDTEGVIYTPMVGGTSGQKIPSEDMTGDQSPEDGRGEEPEEESDCSPRQKAVYAKALRQEGAW